MSLDATYSRFIGWKAKDMSEDRVEELMTGVPAHLQSGSVCYSCFHDDLLDYLGFGIEIQEFSNSDRLKPVDFREDWRPTWEKVIEMLHDLKLTQEEKDAIATYQYVVFS